MNNFKFKKQKWDLITFKSTIFLRSIVFDCFVFVFCVSLVFLIVLPDGKSLFSLKYLSSLGNLDQIGVHLVAFSFCLEYLSENRSIVALKFDFSVSLVII